MRMNIEMNNDIDTVIEVILKLKKEGIPVIINVNQSNTDCNIISRNIRRDKVLEIIRLNNETDIETIKKSYNRKNRKVIRRTILRDCFFLYTQKLINMELKEKKNGGFKYIISPKL
jgi:hypothetical protein